MVLQEEHKCVRILKGKRHLPFEKNKKEEWTMNTPIFMLLEMGISYDEVSFITLMSSLILILVVLILYFLNNLIKKRFPQLYEKLKKYDLF